MTDELTLEGLADWLQHTADDAWVARQKATVAEYLTTNLVLELGRAGVIDGPAFLARIRASISDHPDTEMHTGLAEVLDALRQVALASSSAGSGEGGPGAPPVFH